MNNFTPTSGSPLNDDAYFLFYSKDSDEELNKQLGIKDREFVFVF